MSQCQGSTRYPRSPQCCMGATRLGKDGKTYCLNHAPDGSLPLTPSCSVGQIEVGRWFRYRPNGPLHSVTGREGGRIVEVDKYGRQSSIPDDVLAYPVAGEYPNNGA